MMFGATQKSYFGSRARATPFFERRESDRIILDVNGLGRPLSILLLFGVAFGYLEAAVVDYLRILHEPARRQFYPNRAAGELFPLLTLEQVGAAGPDQHKVLFVEI